MTEAVQLELIKDIPSLIAAIAGMFTVYLGYKTRDIAKKTEENTNHIKDELVAAVSKERFAAGQKHESDARDAKEKSNGTSD